MAGILVLLQHAGGRLAKGSLVALTAARELATVWGSDAIDAVCLGPGAGAAAEEALDFGVRKAWFSEAAALEKYLAVPWSLALQGAFEQGGHATMVLPASSLGKDVAARLAAMIDAGQASDITAVNSDGTLRRPMFAGNAFADVEVTTSRRVVTVRATGFEPAGKTGRSGTREELVVSLDSAIAGEVLGAELSGGSRPELGDAEIVVSGGRALQSSENFEKYIFPLADALGAAVGASRAAVDSGYAPNDWQVGQTGKVVAPNLYVAVGISGAIQHLAGMKDSKVIVAINKDPDAPIYEVADFGLVADLYQAVPELTAAIQKVKG